MKVKCLLKKKGYMYFMMSNLFILLIPFLIGIFAYIGIENMTRNQAINLNDAVNEQIANDVDQNIIEFENLSNVLLTNSRITKYSNFTQKTGITIYELFDIKKDLTNFSISISSQIDYFLFFPNSDMIMTKESSFNPELYYTFCSPKDGGYEYFSEQILNKLYYGEFIDTIMISKAKLGSEYLLYAKSIPDYYSQQAKVTFFAFLDMSKLSGILNSYMDVSSKSMLTIIKDDDVIYRSLSNISDEEIYSAVEKHTTDRINISNNYIVTLRESNVIDGWKYMMMTPMSYVMAPVREIRNTTVIFLGIYLILGIGVSYYLSKRNYAPIKNLFSVMNKYSTEAPSDKFNDGGYISGLKQVEANLIKMSSSNKIASERLSELLPIVKNNILVSLLRGTYYSKNSSYGILRSYGLKFPNRYFTVVLISIKENDDQESLPVMVNMAINEIMDTLNIVDCPNYFVELDIGKYGILINTAQMKNVDQSIIDIAESYVDILKSKYDIISYACTGKTVEGIENIHLSTEQALKASYYHILMPDSKIIEYTKMKKTAKMIFFNEDSEMKFKNYLLSGNADRAYEILDRIIDKNFEKHSIDPQIAQCLISQIFMTTLALSNSIGFDLYSELNANKSELKFLQLGTSVSEMKTTLYDIVNRISEYINKNRKGRLDLIKDNVLNIIEKYITDSNLNQSFIADHLNMSSPYLSFIFKEIFGQNMSDFIGKKRADIAADLLKSTDLNLEKIANRSGFIDSPALIRVFKKHYAVTPGEYRKSGIDIK